MGTTNRAAEIFPWAIPEDAAGQRIDQILSQTFPELSRSQWARHVEEGRVRSEGKVVSASHKPKPGHTLTWVGEEKVARKAEAPTNYTGNLVPRILFEDDDILVIDKPIGLTVHAGAGVGTEQTLVGWLLANGKIRAASGNELDEERPGIVHRLDRGTSGVMVVAKNASAHANLARQFEERTAGRLYWAVVEGRIRSLFQKRNVRLEKALHREPPTSALRLVEDGVCGFVSLLARDPADRTRYRVSHLEGKRAITHFIELNSSDHYSLLELKLGTGRTHQIRVHLSFLGFPILGDGLYGGRGHERIMLHAHSLRITHPRNGQALHFEAPWPDGAAAWLTAHNLRPESRGTLWETLTTDSTSISDRDGLED